MKIKLGEQYKPGETVPANEPYWFRYRDDKPVFYPEGSPVSAHVPSNEVCKYYRAPKIEFVFPKEPKVGEVWSAITKSTGSKVYGRISCGPAGSYLRVTSNVSFLLEDLDLVSKYEECDED